MSDMNPTNYLDEETTFENEVFDNYVIEKNKTIEGDILFSKCIFKMPLVFENLNVSGKLYFSNCVFETYSVIEKCEVHILTLNFCKLKGDSFQLKSNKGSFLNLRGLESKELYVNGEHNRIFITEVTSEKVTLKDVNSIYSQNDSKIKLRKNKIKSLRFEVSSLYSKLLFEEGVYEWILFYGNYHNSILVEEGVKATHFFFESCTVNDRLDVKGGNFESINLSRSFFNGLVLINGFDYLDRIERDLEIKTLSIHSSSFKQDISVSLSKIETLDLSNNDFKKTFDFTSKLITDIVDYVGVFIKGTNQGNIILKEANIHLDISGINLGSLLFKDLEVDHVYFDEFLNNGNMIFSNVKNGNYFTIQDSIVGKLEFLNVNFNKNTEVVISNSNIEKISFSNYPFLIKSYSTNPQIGYGISDKSLSKVNLKNVYNQLKKSAKNKGDFDTANKYQSLEYKYLLWHLQNIQNPCKYEGFFVNYSK